MTRHVPVIFVPFARQDLVLISEVEWRIPQVRSFVRTERTASREQAVVFAMEPDSVRDPMDTCALVIPIASTLIASVDFAAEMPVMVVFVPFVLRVSVQTFHQTRRIPHSRESV